MRLLTIYNEKMQVTVSTTGAELRSVKLNGKERLWQGDEKFWAGRAPVLFPVPGKTKDDVYIWNGKKYPMTFHGLVRKREFVFTDLDVDKVTLMFESNDETKEFYPFDFKFYVTYKVVDDSLEVTYKVENTGNEKMWFSFGSHESYMLDDDLTNYSLVFDEEEKFNSYICDETGPLTNNFDDFGSGKIFNLSKEKFEHFTVILKNINSRKVTLVKGDEKIAQLNFNTNNLLVWTVEGAKYVCIEPWKTLPDSINSDYHVEKRENIGILEGKSQYSNTHTIKYF